MTAVAGWAGSRTAAQSRDAMAEHRTALTLRRTAGTATPVTIRGGWAVPLHLRTSRRFALLQPDSGWTVIALVLLAVGLLVAAARLGWRFWTLLPGAAAVAIAVLAGAVWVNVAYGYYQTWPDAFADLSGAPLGGGPGAPVPVPAVAPRLERQPVTLGHGRLVETRFGGSVTGISRRALIWLPPQYDEPRYAATRFPVLVLLHGDPGEARGFIYGMHVDTAADDLVRSGRAAPYVIVMPTVWVGWHGQQCLDAARGPADESYLTKDVPAAVQQQFRVQPPGPHWALAGLSEGGFCAVDLALRHPTEFAGAASLDGYYAPDVSRGLGWRLFRGNRAAQDAATPFELVRRWSLPAAPAMWLMAGDRDQGDLQQLRDFAAAAAPVSPERVVVVRRGRHTTPSWRTALPDLLVWAGQLVTGHPAPTGALTLDLDGGSVPGPVQTAR